VLVDGSGMSLFGLNPRPTHRMESSILLMINISNGPGCGTSIFLF
jgi:hypothetical protein